MYINKEIIKSRNLSLLDISLIQLSKQQRIEDVSDVLSQYPQEIEVLLGKGFLELIKGKKEETYFQKIRVSKSGVEVLEDVSTPEVIEDDIIIANWLKKIYTDTDREIGNFKKTKLFIALFRVNTGISKNSLAYLCQSFIDDDGQFEWSKKLEFLFFKPSNAYEKFSIDGSKLYQYYLKNQAMFDNVFKKWEN